MKPAPLILFLESYSSTEFSISRFQVFTILITFLNTFKCLREKIIALVGDVMANFRIAVWKQAAILYLFIRVYSFFLTWSIFCKKMARAFHKHVFIKVALFYFAMKPAPLILFLESYSSTEFSISRFQVFTILITFLNTFKCLREKIIALVGDVMANFRIAVWKQAAILYRFLRVYSFFLTWSIFCKKKARAFHKHAFIKLAIFCFAMKVAHLILFPETYSSTEFSTNHFQVFTILITFFNTFESLREEIIALVGDVMANFRIAVWKL